MSSKTSTILVATSCGFFLGSALTYFLSVRRRRNADIDSNDPSASGTSSKNRSRSIPGLRGTPVRTNRTGLTNGGAGNSSSTKRSAYTLARLAHHGVDVENSEHVGFLSSIVRELWPYIDAAGSKTVREMFEPMFAEMLPGPLKRLKFVKLGEVLLVYFCYTCWCDLVPYICSYHMSIYLYFQTLAKYPSNWTMSWCTNWLTTPPPSNSTSTSFGTANATFKCGPTTASSSGSNPSSFLVE